MPTTRRTQTLGLALAMWSLGFACIHMAWAAGWRGGLPDSFAPISDRPWFLAYDIVAGLLMYAAAGGAVLLALGRVTPALRKATVVAAVLALLRGAPAVLFDVMGGDYDVVSFGADVWFTLAGLAGLALWRRTSAASAPATTERAAHLAPSRVHARHGA